MFWESLTWIRYCRYKTTMPTPQSGKSSMLAVSEGFPKRGVRETVETPLAPLEIAMLVEQLQTKALENIDLTLLLESITEHADFLEAQHHELNQKLEQEAQRRENVENLLRKSVDKLQAFFTAMSDMVLIYNRAGLCLKVVSSHPDLPIELLSPQLVGKSIADLVSPEQAKIDLNAIKIALKTGTTVQTEYQSVIHSRLVWFAANISPLDADTVIWVARDITDRKQIEENLRLETERSERLLLNVLPEPIVARLKQNNRAIADHFDAATILFADIVGFTPMAARLGPIELVARLNSLFSRFDQLAEQFGLEKIKTIGDAYMVAAGLPIPCPNHAAAMADMALAMQVSVAEFSNELGEPLQLRIGMHSGDVVAGVIGQKKFIYDLWGDTVNVASRMEALGQPGAIQTTKATYQELRSAFHLTQRGTIMVKGKGPMTTYWLTGRRAPKSPK
jgi:class 3 adenylate cyclase